MDAVPLGTQLPSPLLRAQELVHGSPASRGFGICRVSSQWGLTDKET